MGGINGLIVDESSIENDAIDEPMIEFLRKLKIPENLLNNKNLVKSAKADLLVGNELYDDVNENVLNVPIAAFAGKCDDVFSPEQILQWKDYALETNSSSTS